MQGIRAGSRNPDRAALLNENASFVFFREIDAKPAGPLGSLGVPLTAERSIAVDTLHPAHTSRLATTAQCAAPFSRLTFAQDTGAPSVAWCVPTSTGAPATRRSEQAGRMRQNAQMGCSGPRARCRPTP